MSILIWIIAIWVLLLIIGNKGLMKLGIAALLCVAALIVVAYAEVSVVWWFAIAAVICFGVLFSD